MSLRLRTVDTTEEFQELRQGWTALLARCPSRNIFLTWEWLYTWWEYFGAGKRLFTLVAERDGVIVGIAPLYIRTVPLSRHIKLRQLRLLGTEAVCPDLIDFIVAGDDDAVRAAFVDYLLGEVRGDWDVALLEDLCGTSPSVEMLADKLSSQLIPARLEYSRTCPYLPLPTNWDALLMSLSRQFRKTIRNARKKVEAAGSVNFRRVSDEAAIASGMDQLIDLHQRRWQGKGLPGAFVSPTFVNFHKRIATLFNQQGWLYLTVLEVNRQAVASRYAFIFDHVSYAYQGGFDPDWAEHQVGLAIQSYCIEDEINQQLVEHNFLRGLNPVKLRWTSLSRRSVAVRFGKSDLPHLMAEADVLLDRRIKPMVRGLLPEWSVAGFRRVRQLL